MNSPVAGDLPAKPFGNSYWIRPGQLLAGEHPTGKTSADTKNRLQALLRTGIDTFIDLTRPGEVTEYAELLPRKFEGRPIKHLRFPIPDHDVPSSPELVRTALDVIDAALAEESRVYVHCRAGIGRTGTLMGCYLTRQGHSGEAALNVLNDLWQECERVHTWPTIPETPQQIDYVCQWLESPSPHLLSSDAGGAKLERYEGALLGLAAGNAQGGAAGTSIPPIQLGSDTAMTCCLATSLLNAGGMDSEDQMQHYLRWQRGELFAEGQPADVPAEVRRAIGAWLWHRKPLAGSHDPANLDAHPLARTVAVALRYVNDPQTALKAAADAARPTLQSPLALDACRVFAALLVSALQGAAHARLASAEGTEAFALLRQHPLKPPIVALVNGGWRHAPAGNDIVSVLAGAWRHFADTTSFEAGMRAILQEAAAPATAGAVYGALAGAHYGENAIPAEWRAQVAQPEILAKLVVGLFTAANKQ